MTVRFTIQTPNRLPPSADDELHIRPGGRLARILTFIADGPKPTTRVYPAARKNWTNSADRENRQTRQCLRVMEEAGWIIKSDTVEITDAGRRALDAAGETVAGRRAA